jgi:hypothetical protein
LGRHWITVFADIIDEHGMGAWYHAVWFETVYSLEGYNKVTAIY